ncbi:hypothetical protein RJT34_11018 [Clitoria ternatea]|uniref:Uncharacterized protein n=1 Tax=Clitoria ternatea TaxID=43366 RepID=A0AAN9JLA0_CLITE
MLLYAQPKSFDHSIPGIRVSWSDNIFLGKLNRHYGRAPPPPHFGLTFLGGHRTAVLDRLPHRLLSGTLWCQLRRSLIASPSSSALTVSCSRESLNFCIFFAFCFFIVVRHLSRN